jgi:hypothetical protein
MLADDYAIEVKIDEYGGLYLCSSSATSGGGTGSSGSTGIRISDSSGATWSNLTPDLPWPFAWPIETVPLGGGAVRLFVGSPGSGVWTTILTHPVAVEAARGNTELRLAGFRPNPARGHVSVAFALATSESAVLEVFDLAGRSVARRDVGSMGPGSHVLALGPAFRPAPGVYNIRLTQGSRSLRARSVVLR